MDRWARTRHLAILATVVAASAWAAGVSAQHATFPEAMWGFRFGRRVTAMPASCVDAGGTWDAGGMCRLAVGTPDEHFVAELSGEPRAGELTSLWEHVAPPGDRAPWVDFFLRRHAELTEAYGPARPVFGTVPACAAALVERRDPACISSVGTRVVLAWDVGRGQVRLEMYALPDVDRVRETWYVAGHVPPDEPDYACEWP